MARTKPDYCDRWPHCVCAEHWRYYQNAPVEHFENAKPIIEAMLACIRERCPDKRVRAHASVQLMRPIFNEAERLQ